MSADGSTNIVSARRPPRRLLALCIGGAMAAALPAMLFSLHLPTPLAVRIAQLVGAAAGLWAGWESRPNGLFDPARSGHRNWLTKSVFLRLPLMALFVFFMVFTAVEDGVMAIVTAAVGKPGSRTLTVTGVSGSRRGCDHFKVREVAWLLNRALCASRSDLDQAQPGDTLVVYGRSSPLGLNVERYELQPSARGRGDDTTGQMP